jgi:hypothetical protein
VVSSSDEREDLQWSGEEEAERRPIRVVVDTSSDDLEFVEQNEIQDHVPLKYHTPRKSTRGARGEGRGSTATHRGTVVSKRPHPLSFSSVGGSRSLPSSPSRGHHRAAFMICHGAAPRPCSTGRHGAATSSSRRHWRDGLIRGRRPGRSATIFHRRQQQSDILVCDQLQQGAGCTIDKEEVP